MDNTEKYFEGPRVLSVCTGYGGIEKGLEMVIEGMRPVAYLEIEAFAVENLVSKMESGLIYPAPVWTDVKTFPGESFYGCVDIITGGYPCQPFSTAGERKGKQDPRHLWPYIREIINATRPVCCFFENVEGHLSLGLREVQASLHRMDYTVEAGIFSASECGASQQRKRVFILAVSSSIGLRRGNNGNTSRNNWKIQTPGHGSKLEHAEYDGSYQLQVVRWIDKAICRAQKGTAECWDAERTNQLADACREGHKRAQRGEAFCGKESASCFSIGECDYLEWPFRPGYAQYQWEPLRSLGNSKSNDKRRLSVSSMHGERQQAGRSDSEPANGKKINRSSNKSKIGKRRGGKIESALGGNSDGSSAGLDFAGLSGLSNHELAEIYEWMERNTNRIDEIRSCGNGVVPQTVALAFITLWQKMRLNYEGVI